MKNIIRHNIFKWYKVNLVTKFIKWMNKLKSDDVYKITGVWDIYGIETMDRDSNIYVSACVMFANCCWTFEKEKDFHNKEKILKIINGLLIHVISFFNKIEKYYIHYMKLIYGNEIKSFKWIFKLMNEFIFIPIKDYIEWCENLKYPSKVLITYNHMYITEIFNILLNV